MRSLSQLRLGRSLQKRNRRKVLRRNQPRFAGKKLQSQFRAEPVKPRPSQPFLPAGLNPAELLA